MSHAAPSDPARWKACVDGLYDAVGREHDFAAALSAFRPFFNARGVTYLTVPDSRYPQTSHLGSVGVDETALVEYHSHFSAHDEWVLAAHRRSTLAEGAVFRGSELVDRQSIRRSYFGREFLSRYGVIDVASAIVEMAAADAPTTFISFYRHGGQRPFSKGDARRLGLLVPHLRHALRLHRRLAPALALGETLAQVVRRLGVPLMFVSAPGGLADANHAATAELERAQGWVRLHDSQLQVNNGQAWAPITQVLGTLRDSPHGSTTLDLLDGQGRGAALSLRAVHGAASDRLAEHPALAVATLVPGTRDKARALREVHGLTAAEARVALQLAQGLTAAQIAQQSGLAMTTLRTHIGQARAKLGINRQAQLVSAVLSL